MNTWTTANVGTFSVRVTLVGPTRDEIETDALVEPGVTYSAFPAALLFRIGVCPTGKRWFELPDRRRLEYEVGAVNVRLARREVPMLVVFDPTATRYLLGATALENLSFSVDPVNQRLVPVDALLK